MKKIYIVLTITGTALSNIIRFYTKNEYTHVSISLDRKLDRLYSFGRLNPYNPFWGGLVHEGITFGTFKRFKETEAGIIELKVTDEQYSKAEEKIEEMLKHRKDYKFNIRGMLLAGFNISRKKENALYCAEFVKSVLDTAGIDKGLPDIIKPEDFKNIKDGKFIYKGLLKDYTEEK